MDIFWESEQATFSAMNTILQQQIPPSEKESNLACFYGRQKLEEKGSWILDRKKKRLSI